MTSSGRGGGTNFGLRNLKALGLSRKASQEAARPGELPSESDSSPRRHWERLPSCLHAIILRVTVRKRFAPTRWAPCPRLLVQMPGLLVARLPLLQLPQV